MPSVSPGESPAEMLDDSAYEAAIERLASKFRGQNVAQIRALVLACDNDLEHAEAVLLGTALGQDLERVASDRSSDGPDDSRISITVTARGSLEREDVALRVQRGAPVEATLRHALDIHEQRRCQCWLGSLELDGDESFEGDNAQS